MNVSWSPSDKRNPRNPGSEFYVKYKKEGKTPNFRSDPTSGLTSNVADKKKQASYHCSQLQETEMTGSGTFPTGRERVPIWRLSRCPGQSRDHVLIFSDSSPLQVTRTGRW